MAQRERNREERAAEHRERVGGPFDLDQLVEATLSGFAVTSALGPDDPDVLVDTLGRAHQAEPIRLIADKRRTNAARFQVLFTH